MPLFDSPQERQRKEKLKTAEDRRLRFVESCEKEGFRPERMLLATGEKSNLMGICREGDLCRLVVGPELGEEGEYRIETFDPKDVKIEEVYVRSEGMGGMFGFGTKGQQGFRALLPCASGTHVFLLVINLNSALIVDKYKKNPLLKAGRRRGDANVVWDFQPLDKTGYVRFARAFTEITGVKIP